MKTVTMVLNGYKRQHTLAEQIKSIKQQTYPIEKVIYFNLKSNDKRFIPDYELLERENIEFVDTSHNYGVWGRLAFSLNANTDFVCIMDDDIIPGKKYIENCVRCYEKQPGIYGTMGAIIDFKDNQLENFGWCGIHNTEMQQVNYLFQTWFMPREVLSAFWSEAAPEQLTHNWRCGEDMYISLMGKKVLGLRTYVVPHPEDDLEYWGNTKGLEQGQDEFAIHLDPAITQSMLGFFKFSVQSGLEVVGAPLLNARVSINRALPECIFRETRKKWIQKYVSDWVDSIYYHQK